MTDTKEIRLRAGDHLVTTTVEVEPAIIDFNDILEAATVEPDDMYEAPWDNCDGWEHEAESPSHFDNAEVEAMRGYAWSQGNRERIVVVLGEEANDGWGLFDSLRKQGASRQVAAEMVALSRRTSLDKLVDWYENGWEWWVAKCEFKDHYASVGGIDDYEYADSECLEDVALEVAGELEDEGYEIINRPAKKALWHGYTKEAFKDRLNRNLASQSWKE